MHAYIVTAQFLSINADGNISSHLSVTFNVGKLESCFNFSFVVNEEAGNSDQFKLIIINNANKTEVDKGSESLVVTIVSRESRMLNVYSFICKNTFIFPYNHPLPPLI